MVHRLALFLGGVGAAAILAVAMNLGGFFAAAPTAADGTAAVFGGNQIAATTPETTQTIVDKVYVEPTPEQAVVHVNNPPRNTSATTTSARPHGGQRGERDDRSERDDRGESGDD
jgi:hypothetical protein